MNFVLSEFNRRVPLLHLSLPASRMVTLCSDVSQNCHYFVRSQVSCQLHQLGSDDFCSRKGNFSSETNISYRIPGSVPCACRDIPTTPSKNRLGRNVAMAKFSGAFDMKEPPPWQNCCYCSSFTTSTSSATGDAPSATLTNSSTTANLRQQQQQQLLAFKTPADFVR